MSAVQYLTCKEVPHTGPSNKPAYQILHWVETSSRQRVGGRCCTSDHRLRTGSAKKVVITDGRLEGDKGGRPPIVHNETTAARLSATDSISHYGTASMHDVLMLFQALCDLKLSWGGDETSRFMRPCRRLHSAMRSSLDGGRSATIQLRKLNVSTPIHALRIRFARAASKKGGARRRSRSRKSSWD